MSDAEVGPLLELFRAELREQAPVLTRALLDLGRAPESAQALDELAQAAHTVRGAARIVHLDAAAELADALGGAFGAAQAGRRRLSEADLDLCLRAVDALAALGETDPAAWSAERAEDVARLTEALGRLAQPAPPPEGEIAKKRLQDQPGAPATGEEKPVAGAPGWSDGVETAPKPQAAASPPAEFVPLADPALLEMFREEVRAHAATLTAGLLELEREPTDAQRVEPLMRAAHSLKGAARIVGLDPAVQLAHELEDAFVAVQAGRARVGPAEIDALLRGADLLALLGEEDLARWAATRHDEVARLRPAVAAIVRGEAAPAVAPAAPPPAVAPAAAESPAAPAPAGATPVEATESVVRVTAHSLNRLMSLAGESLVQARWLQPFATSLLRLKKHQDHLAAQLDGLAQGLSAGQPAEALAGAVEEARRQAGRCRQVLAERIGEFEDHAAAAEGLNSRLYREVIVSRMRPFGDGAAAFPRLVRDTARRLGKQARLEVVGPATEVDRDILERLEAPLTHLLRNAVDHGLEAPDDRAAAGKPAEGVVRVEARHLAGMLAITVGDDGGGIDVEKVRRKVVERRQASAEMAARMSEAELLEFLFLPGFSTAGQVTEVSGRGVGLDVVRDTVRKVGGSVQVTTRPGQGTTFHLLLPITLSVLRAVLVDVGGEPYAFPHNRIDRLLRVPREAVRSLEHRQFVSVGGRNVGLVLAAQLLDLPAGPPAGDELPVLLLSDATGAYGLIVEAIRGEQDLVVRPLDPRLGKVPNVSAAAVLDDGAPVLIADVEDLIRSMDQYIQSGTLRRCDPEAAAPGAKKRVLVVDDSITVREVQRQILRTHGYEVEVAVDGQDGWNKVRAGPFDLVISDVDMPRVTGLEFVRRIRDDQALRDVPVIIVSYKDRDEDRLRGLEAGANHYLTKSSFHDHTFLDAVAALIGR
jgi:two-component system, chemotaxis family, sensor histidine kinase and response regulator WspE